MDINFYEGDQAPKPRDQVKIEELETVVYPDRFRVFVHIRVTLFQERPNLLLTARTTEGKIAAELSIIETMHHDMEFTMHLRGLDDPVGDYTLSAELYYEIAQPAAGSSRRRVRCSRSGGIMWLSTAQAQQIVAHARAEQPREACGIIAGREDRADEIIPIANTAAEPLHNYYMDEHALAAALMRLQGRGLELIGFYHSHPSSDPIPSPTDQRQATYPDTPYLIVGLKNNDPRLAAWLLRPGQVTQVDLQVGGDPPPRPAATPSTAQKTAILISVLIAFALLIVVSLTLLPPAPVIPR